MSSTVNGDAPLAGVKPTLRPSKASEKAAAAEARQKERAKAAGTAPPNAAEEGPDEKPRRRRRMDRETVGNAAKRLAAWHAVAAAMTQMPELLVSEAEAEQLVIAGNDVAAEFDLEVGGKTAAVLGLLGTAGAVYFPRMIAFMARLEQMRQQRAAGAGGPIVEGQVA